LPQLTFASMYIVLRVVLTLCLVSFVAPIHLWSWGFFAHKRINRLAVMTLPPQMIGFYKRNIEYITEHAVDPDKRRYIVEGEAERHFIDIDHYSTTEPFKVVPRRWKDAVDKFSEDTLKAYGIVPWHIDVMMYRLTQAFKDLNYDLILKYSADLGHYIGDAHVPLHTTENYNGQLTDQKGIHAFWESRLPELFCDDYDYFTGRAKYIDSPIDYAWDAVEDSHTALDTVLSFEKRLHAEFPSDRKYTLENRGAALVKNYSEEYSRAYHDMMGGMVERRMRAAIIAVGSMWYTAWINAGQPDLQPLYEKQLSPEAQDSIVEFELQVKQSGNGLGRDHE